MVEVFTSKIIEDAVPRDQLKDLVEDFRDYKTTGNRPDHFGRDVPYDNECTLKIVKEEEVKHIHLRSADSDWPVRAMQFQMTSDCHLLYCQGAMNDDQYLLIAILEPNAHQLARNNNVMMNVGQIAENFRFEH
ncbi:MAG: type II toxin-antitoxin system YafO family toxin [Marinobacter sp.]|nr:type II toxin-antitoxin system YafO family toxin [Marinobacter sp.]